MTITDEFMRTMLGTTRPYCIVILKAGPNRNGPDANAILWEHGRANFGLRADGRLAIVCPVTDGGDVAGIGIFDAGVDDVRQAMERDPAVRAGVLTYEVHPCLGFPGDCLPLAKGSSAPAR